MIAIAICSIIEQDRIYTKSLKIYLNEYYNN